MDLFGLASGLLSNMDKSVATPIGCSEQEMDLVRDALSCKVSHVAIWGFLSPFTESEGRMNKGWWTQLLPEFHTGRENY